MLNTVLTVRAHQANSHRGIGWEEFTDAAIMALNSQDRPIVFILWGAPAQRKKRMLNNQKHLILEAPHPSPLSAYRGFFGSRPFSQTNAFLEKNGIDRSTGRLTEPGKRVKSGSSEWKLPDFLRKLLYFGDKKPSNSTGKLSRTLDAGKSFPKISRAAFVSPKFPFKMAMTWMPSF